MSKDKDTIQYFVYARKSSESEDRQIQSIDDQIKGLNRLAGDLKLSVKGKLLTEAKSAKKPGNRPIFEEMIRRIESGEANGILCWQINRLSRNPIDSGKLSWLLQQGIIKSIRTIDREYLPNDNVLLFNVESGMANQFILDLSKGVKRGLQSKIEKGWMPGSAPLGYLNTMLATRGENYLVKDEERFPLLRKAWELMLTGSYTPPKILEILNNEWGFRTRPQKRKGGKPMSRSTIYRIFTNQFYAGLIPYKGQVYQGKHEAMVTLDEFDHVQVLLGRKGKPRPKSHSFAFTGLMRCGECGAQITAIEKTKIIKKTGELKTFTYYYCTRRKQGVPCSQKTYISLDDLEPQIEIEIEKYTIIPEFRDWALEILRESNDKEIEDRSKIYETQQKAFNDAQKQLDNLTKMRYRDLITDDEFSRERGALQAQIRTLQQKLRETESRAEKWLELTEKTFNFATYALKEFVTTDDLQKKKEILIGLGENPMLKDGKVSIQANEWLVPIANGYPPLKEEYDRLELTKTPMNTEKEAALASIRTRWRGRPDSNRRFAP